MYLGIDLGTTNTVVAVGRKNVFGLVEAEVVELYQWVDENVEQTKTLPSVLYFEHGSVDIYIGQEGKNKRHQDSSRVIYNTKRYMGQDDGWNIDGKEFKAKDVAGQILRWCRQVLAKDFNDELDSVVITVPASFDASQTEDTVEAARIAGFKKEGIRVLHEPTAALLDYVHKQSILSEETREVDFSESKRVLVFDLGGGTCDVSIIDVTQEEYNVNFEEIAIGRYEDLGGIDFDALVAKGLLNKFFEVNSVKESDFDEEVLEVMFQQLRLFAEEGKEWLSDQIKKKKLFGMTDFDDITKKKNITDFYEGKTFKFELSKKEYDDYTKSLYSREEHINHTQDDYEENKSIIKPIENTIRDYQIDVESIDYIFMTGGMSKFDTVQEKICELIQKPVIYPDDPMHAVARGAAIYHYYLVDVFDEKASSKKIITPKAVLAESILIDIDEGLPEVIISKNQTIPYEGVLENRFTTTSPSGIRIDLYSGESAYDSRLRIQRSYIKEFDVPIISGTSFDVEYSISENKVVDLRLIMHDQHNQVVEVAMDRDWSEENILPELPGLEGI